MTYNKIYLYYRTYYDIMPLHFHIYIIYLPFVQYTMVFFKLDVPSATLADILMYLQSCVYIKQAIFDH